MGPKLLRVLAPKNAGSGLVVETLQKDGFRVDKLLYESMPGFYVTAAVFVPDGLTGRAPAIIYCSGHAAEAFRSTTYQRVILNLVKKGFIVLALGPAFGVWAMLRFRGLPEALRMASGNR